MGERRNWKSSRDTVEETKHPSGMGERNSWTGKERHSRHHSGHHHEFSASGTTGVPESTDNSGWSSWDSVEEKSTAPAPTNDCFTKSRLNALDRKEIGGRTRYHRDVSPGFDERHTYNHLIDSIEDKPTAPTNDSFTKSRLNALDRKEIGGRTRYHRDVSPGFDERHTYNHPIEKDRSHSHRNLERGRSRSRSRTGGRSKSRSLSRGRERGRKRSRGDGSARDQSSPVGDYRRKSYGLSDRRIGSEKSSQVCRSFASGRCMRGSQCRFIHPDDTSRRNEDLVEDQKGESWRNRADHGRTSKHPDDTSRRNEDLVEDQKGESWRNRADHGRASKHSYDRGHGSEPRDDVSGPYRGDEEKLRNKGRSSVPCKDFMNGNCRFGDTCKFSHTSGDSFGKGARNASFDRDTERQSKNRTPLCKYFAAGNCDKDNCRFSHEDPKRTNVEDRRGEVTDKRNLHDKGNTLNGPTWDDEAKNSDTVASGWDETIVTRTTSADVTNGKCDDRKGDRQGWPDYSLTRENNPSPPMKIGKYGEGRGITKPVGRRGDKHSSHDKGNTWNGPTWDDAARNLDTMPSGWNETIVMKTTSSDDITNGKHDDRRGDRQGRPDNSLYRENKSSPPRETGIYRKGRRITDKHSLHDKGNTWNGPTWDDAARNSDTIPSGWNEAIVMKTTSTDDIINGKCEDKQGDWQGWHDDSLNMESKPSPPREIGNYEEGRGITESVGTENTSAEQEHLILHPSKFNQAGFSSFQGQRIHEDQTSVPQNVSPAVHVEQQHPYETDRGLDMLTPNGSNGFTIDLNGPGIEMAKPLNLQPPIKSEPNAPLYHPYTLTSEKSSEMTNYPTIIAGQQVASVADPTVSLMQGFVNEESQIEVLNSLGTLRSISNQPNPLTVSLDLSNPMENGEDTNEHENHSFTRGLEPNKQMHVKQSSPSPFVGKEFNKSAAERLRSPKLKQEDAIVDSNGNGGNEAVGEESNGLQENKVPETLDGNGKVEESGANKDEKGMRIFKNALIEFVKDILKPKWKEGKMSRDDHKTIVKKVVEKVTSTIQAEHVPKTQDKVELYLSSSKPKISKLIQAYVERCLKKDS